MDDHLSKPFTIDQLREVILKYAQVNGKNHSGQPAVSQNDDQEKQSSSTQTDHANGFDTTALDRIRALEAPGSNDLIKTVISHYCNETPKILESLKGALQGNDAPSVNKLAHSLKSSSANVGAIALSELCKEMELAGRANTLARCPELLFRIEREYEVASRILAKEM
jgi:HPt (histidine-containing phosphotransfer) domain-containing protein